MRISSRNNITVTSVTPWGFSDVDRKLTEEDEMIEQKYGEPPFTRQI